MSGQPSGATLSTTSRIGYLVAAALGGVLFYVINVQPGWETLPFLTPDTTQILVPVNLSIIVGVAFNLIHIVRLIPWLKTFGDLLTTGIGLIASVRLLQVFPFVSVTGSFDWHTPVRVVLIVATAGAAIGLIVHAVRLVGLTVRSTRAL